MFREYLISNGGISSYTQREELKRLKFYLETFEHFISQQESSEIVALEADSAHLNEEDKSEVLVLVLPCTLGRNIPHQSSLVLPNFPDVAYRVPSDRGM
jgi:hypothetical protein